MKLNSVLLICDCQASDIKYVKIDFYIDMKKERYNPEENEPLLVKMLQSCFFCCDFFHLCYSLTKLWLLW